MKRRSDLYLKDILEAISRVKKYTDSMELEDFDTDMLTKDAVMRNLYIIGEAVSQLQEEFKKKHPEVPWSKIKGFRNIAAHKYWKVNKERVWDIIQNKLDELEQQVKDILENIDN